MGDETRVQQDGFWRGKMQAEIEQLKSSNTDTKASLKKLYEKSEKTHTRCAREGEKTHALAYDISGLSTRIDKGDARMSAIEKTVSDISTEVTKVVTRVVIAGTIAMVVIGAGLSLAVNLLSK